MRSAAVRAASQRIRVLRILCLAGFLVLAARAAHLSVIEKRGLLRHDGQVTTYLNLRPGRGVIYDRHGAELAVTVRVPSAFVIPTEVEDIEATVRGLAEALDMPRRQVAGRLAGRDAYTFVARWVTREQARRVAQLGLPGVHIEAEPRRTYPLGALAGNLVGFANIDGEGSQGLEQEENAWLHGKAMRVRVERDARGRIQTQDTLNPAETRGGDLLLTIDASMQAAAEAELAAATESSQASSGVAITLDPHTGDILALAETPGFDPNTFRTTPYAQSRTRSFVDALEPGSTMKSFLVAIALEERAFEPDHVFETDEGWIRVRGKTIRDHRAYGPLDATGILRVSSNVGAVLIAQELGRELYYAGLRRFGFGSRTGVGFPSESAGILRRWESWKPVDHANVAFGQGISVTTIQLAAAMGALADGGTWRTPRLVRARRQPGGEWVEEPPGPTRTAVRPETADRVMQMLEAVVSGSGTARRAGLRGVRVAGKTGTAQKFDEVKKAYSRDRYTAWFMGAVPADAPKLVILVGIDEPGVKAHTGGDVAAPAFAAIAAAQLARLGIITEPAPIPARREPETTVAAQSDEQQATPAAAKPSPSPPRATALAEKPAAAGATPRRAGDTRVATSRRPSPPLAVPAVSAPPPDWRATARVEAVLLPDFRGLSVTEVLALTKANGLELERVGHGHAIGQDPSPGTVIVGADRKVVVRFAAQDARARASRLRRGDG